MPLQALIFDMGDILFDASLWRRWLTVRLNELGVSITYEQLVQAWEALLVDVYRGRADYWQRFGQLLADQGLDPSAAAALTQEARDKGKALAASRTLFDGVAQTLADLKAAGIKLAVLSDNESGQAAVVRMLADLGVADCFDAVLSSRDLGHAKPDPRAFAAAVQAIGLTQTACGFVGHDIDELTGAREAGLLAIGFNYHPEAPADRYIERFGDLLDVVKEQT
ncbi:MAG: HAD hydrolase-like protein [Planctomycetaceae bacterium]|nr:HAD hydrolase-like protein [Planctomycetaceae bacterium]